MGQTTTARVPDELRAKKFVAVDDQGNRLVELFAEGGQAPLAGLRLFDRSGKQVAYFTVVPGPLSMASLSLSEETGKSRISFLTVSARTASALSLQGVVGASTSITLTDSSGKNRIELGLENDEARVRVSDKTGQARTVLGAITLENPVTGVHERRPESSLALFDKDGKVVWRAP
jgi:hypothetical protein